MNFKKILSLVLVAIFALAAFSSCVTEEAAEVNVEITFEAGEDRVYKKTVAVPDEDGDGKVSVLDVVKEAVSITESLTITYNTAGSSVKDVANYTECTKDDKDFYWVYTINGVEPEKGKAADNMVVEGDVILYTFVYAQVIEGTDKTETLPYKSTMELFGENEDEEAVEEEAAEEE